MALTDIEVLKVHSGVDIGEDGMLSDAEAEYVISLNPPQHQEEGHAQRDARLRWSAAEVCDMAASRLQTQDKRYAGFRAQASRLRQQSAREYQRPEVQAPLISGDDRELGLNLTEHVKNPEAHHPDAAPALATHEGNSAAHHPDRGPALTAHVGSGDVHNIANQIAAAVSGVTPSVKTDATLTGDGTTGDLLKVAYPYTEEREDAVDLAILDAKRVETDHTLTGVGTTEAPLKVANPGGGGSDGLTSEQVDAKITTHAGDSDAHHTPTAAGVTSGNVMNLINAHAGIANAHHVPPTGGGTAANNIANIAMPANGQYFRILTRSGDTWNSETTSASELIQNLHDRVVVLSGAAADDIRIVLDRRGGADLLNEQAFILVNDTDKTITEYSSAGGVGDGAPITGKPEIPPGSVAYIELTGDTSTNSADIRIRVTQGGSSGGGTPEPAPYVAQAPRQVADYWIVDMSDGVENLFIQPSSDSRTPPAGARVMDAEDVFGKVLQVISNANQQVTISVEADASADLTGNGVIVTNLTRQGLLFAVDSDDNNRDEVLQAQAVGETFLYGIQGANSVQRFPYIPTGEQRIANYISRFDADARYLIAAGFEANPIPLTLTQGVPVDVWIDTEVPIKPAHIYTVSLIADFTASGDSDPTPGASSYQNFPELSGDDLLDTVVKVPGAVITDSRKDEIQGIFRPVQWVNSTSPGNIQDGLIIFGRNNAADPTLVFAFIYHGAVDRRPDSQKWTRGQAWEKRYR